MSPHLSHPAITAFLLLLGTWGMISLWQLGPRGSRLWLIPALVPIPILLLAPPAFTFFPMFFMLGGTFFWIFGFPRVMDSRQTLRILMLAAMFFLLALNLTYP